MPFNPRTGCATCDRIRTTDKHLLERINTSRAFVPGGESLRSIAADVGISYESVYNHSKKHQAPSKAKLDKRIKQFETKEKFKDIVTAGESKTVAVYAGHVEARREILDRGMKALAAGDLKMSMNAIVSLLAQEQKAEENAKDRSLELMKMFNYFASGSGGGAADGPTSPEPVEGEIIG